VAGKRLDQRLTVQHLRILGGRRQFLVLDGGLPAGAPAGRSPRWPFGNQQGRGHPRSQHDQAPEDAEQQHDDDPRHQRDGQNDDPTPFGHMRSTEIEGQSPAKPAWNLSPKPWGNQANFSLLPGEGSYTLRGVFGAGVWWLLAAPG